MSAVNGNSRYDEKRFAEFHARHGRKPFTPVFNAQLEAIARDATAPATERVLALAQSRAWGSHSDCAIAENGETLTQADFGRILKLSPSRVCRAVEGLQERNLLQTDGQGLYPVDDPADFSLAETFKSVADSRNKQGMKGETFRLFREQVWTVEHADIESERAALQARLCQIKCAELAAYKRWLKDQKVLRTPATPDEDHCALPPGGVADSPPPPLPTPATNERPSLKENEVLNTVPSSSFSSLVTEALARHGTIDDDVVTQLIQDCRTNAPDCSAEEIAHFVLVKAQLINPATQNPVGFLLRAVPKCFAGESFRAYRAKIARAAQGREEQPVPLTPSQELNTLERFVEALPDHPDAASMRRRIDALREAPGAKTKTAGAS